MKHLKILLILLVPLAAWGATITGGTITGGSVNVAAGGGSQTTSIFDDFSSDQDAHYDHLPAATCTVTAGEMNHSGAGYCKPKDTSGNTPPGDQPSTVNHWALTHTNETTGTEKSGPAVRLDPSGSPASTADHYLARCDPDAETGLVHLYNCTNVATCTEFHATGIVCAGGFGANVVGDIIGFAVAGTDADTEFCVWFWENAAAGPTIDDTTVPDDWGNAAECISSDGTAAESTMTAFFAAATATATWDEAPDAGALDYSDTNKNCGMQSAVGGENFVEFVCGDL